MPNPLDESRKLEGASDAPASEHADRRRPGRQDVNPSLIPLLRKGPLGRGTDVYDQLAPRSREDLAPGQGIMVAVLLSGLFWAAVFFALR